MILKKFTISIIALGALLTNANAYAQRLTPLSNGFSIGRSTGISSTFRQISKSESNVLIDVLTKNVVGDGSGHDRIIPDDYYNIVNPQEPFAVVQERDANNAGTSETMINNSSFVGFNHTVFSQ